MKPALTFHVRPALPERLARLQDVAYNLRWAWNHDSTELFRRLDSELWESTGHNPVLLLGTVAQDQLAAASGDEGFLAHFDRVVENLDAYMAAKSSWFQRHYSAAKGDAGHPLVAYFSAEFGLTGCLGIFAGGLGVLSGDHLKSTSDLGVPLVGVGLLYQQGYFRQTVNESGWQQEAYEDNDFHNLPMKAELGSDGRPLTIEVEMPGRKVKAQIWKIQVGRLALYLLDTNLPANSPADQNITDQLYGGDREMRIQQEIVLGIGGFRALQALGLRPRVYHMNEGHSALLALEWIRQTMAAHGVSFAEARQATSAGMIFTTHTPVSAGHDFFSPDLVKHYFTEYATGLGLTISELLGLGRQNPDDAHELFCMTTLALRLSENNNAVSRLHGVVSREMWKKLWPAVPLDEIPIHHVTNGVHFRSWISPEMDHLFERYLGARWQEEPFDRKVWSKTSRIPAEELWHTHERRREQLVAFVRRRLRRQLENRGATQAEIETSDEVLDAEAMTIGFARRFATYKRATLLLRDPERLARILNHPTRPVQIVYAGAAHPKDNEGKELIKRIITLARQEQFRRRLVFLEGYGITATRYLVQGCDVWLNTPRRPMEASGTSGMKSAVNGGLNLSTLDGWWDEAWFGRECERGRNAAFDEPIGWAIGRAENYEDHNYQDEIEAGSLYDLLERDVVPTYYDRGPDGVPRRWVSRMKASLGTLCPFFNTHRMVREYTERFYLPAAERSRQISEQEMARARALASWKVRMQEHWKNIRAEVMDGVAAGDLPVGHKIEAKARVHLGVLTPEEVAVELYLGQVNAHGELVQAQAAPMQPVSLDDAGAWVYQASAECSRSGLHGYTVRVLPRHPDLTTMFLPGLIVWAK